MRRYSPYNYAFNNPIRFIDPDGMAPFIDYFGIEGNYLGTDGNNNGKIKVALSRSTEQAITSSINGGKVTINESSYSDLISNPTSNEIQTMDDSFAKMEANNMNEQGFAVGTKDGLQSIQTVSSTGNTSVSTGRAVAVLAGSGNDIGYDAHTHGAVIKSDPSTGDISVGGSGSSAADRAGSIYGQANLVLGFDVQNNTSKLTASDISNARNNAGRYVPLNPNLFNKTATFYNQSGDLRTLNYNTFKSNISSIRLQSFINHLPKYNLK